MCEWRPIPGFEGYYEASTAGQVRSVERRVVVTASRMAARGYQRRIAARVLKPSISNGYESVALWKSHCVKQARVHVLVAEAFLGGRPPGFYVCHKDGNLRNNSVGNLYYGTPADNVADMRSHGTMALGEQAGAAKLSVGDVNEIRALKGVATQDELAARFGVGQAQISRIQARLRWKHISEGAP